ncbi:Two-component response regulator-like aprr5 [Thalictrum thalictroides]|uniref:Two-component response regulator-like aprr5 n=1 Tax=Thalictrum thalictroides TaxID=46969 RepID=A0A7J6V5R5_THATH|nr:Two-component response regulator-like aprr5 [Thalictrum thalictroides]
MECEIIDLVAGTSKKTEVGSVNDVGNRKKNELSNRNRELNVDSNSGKRVIRWERFLPKKVLRVLLVENDDSTRHIVAALLRKCNYQVADGLKAWGILKEKHYNFDLVLTEVEMPSLSGTDLLSKIMSSDLYKNIPAVNPETGNSNYRKLDSGSANETYSNHSSSNAGNANLFEISDSCDKGSDTRSSCSIAGIRTKSMQKQEGPGPPQIEYTNLLKETDLELEKHEAYVAKGAASSIYKNGKAKDKLTEIEIKLTLSIHKKAVSTDEVGEENVPNVGPPYSDGGSVAPKLFDQHDRASVPSEVIIGTEISENCCFQGLDIDHPENHLHKSENAGAKRNTCDSDSLPSLELSLRSQLKSQNGNDFPENHVLKHSEASAFSRYGNARRRLSCPSSSSSSFCIRTNEFCNSNGQISTTNDNSKNAPSSLLEMSTTSQVNRGEDSEDCQFQPSSGSNKEGACPSYIPSGEDVCHPSTGKTLCHHLQYGVGPFPVPVGAIPFQNFWGGYGATFQPHLYPQPSVSLSGSTALPKELVVVSPRPSAENGNQANNAPQTVNYHPTYGNHNPPQLLHWMEPRTDVESAPSRVLLMTSGEVYQGGNSNCGVTIASERKGNNADMDVAANEGIALEKVRGDGIQNCTMNWLDFDRSRREAALTKFRLKRKDRCFEKKVRYHNRKKLAEQRPRLKGQFVCQAVAESTSLATESD